MTTAPSTRGSVPPTTLRQAGVAIAGLSAVFLFEMLDNSILNVALPTIGRELHASTTALQWVTGAYSVVFGGLMLAFGAVSDRFGPRRMMLIGLSVLGLASLSTAFVTTAEQLIAVRVVTGVAAAITTPLSMSLAFRLFDDDGPRFRAISMITTVGLVGLAVGPTVGGLVLAVAPWQVLLLVNVPIAVLAILGIRSGVAADRAEELRHGSVDVLGAVLGTGTIVLALVAPTLFVSEGAESWTPWAAAVGAATGLVGFVIRERLATVPLIDLALIARPLVSSGLAYQAAVGLATAGMGYLVTLQLQLDWGWPPALASVGLLPQVITLLASGPFIAPFVQRAGIGRAAWLGAAAVVVGLGTYAALGRAGYPWVAVAMVLVAAGMRVVGVVAGVNVLRGLPKDRGSIGAAMSDTATEVMSAVGIAVVGTVLASVFRGTITATSWTAAQTAQFESALTIGALTLTGVAAALVGWAILRARLGEAGATLSVEEALQEA